VGHRGGYGDRARHVELHHIETAGAHHFASVNSHGRHHFASVTLGTPPTDTTHSVEVLSAVEEVRRRILYHAVHVHAPDPPVTGHYRHDAHKLRGQAHQNAPETLLASL